jgi:hypothetical protein
MHDPQLVFQVSPPLAGAIAVEKPESLRVLADTLLIPLYATLLSADVLFLHSVSKSRWFKRTVGKLRGSAKLNADQSTSVRAEEDRTNLSLRQRFHERIALHGGNLAFALGVIRFLGGIPLLGLALHLFFLERQRENSSGLEIPGWVDVALIITFVCTSTFVHVSIPCIFTKINDWAYTLLLSLAYIVTRPPAYSKFSLVSHFNFVLFVT